MPEWISANQLGKLLNCKENTVYAAIEYGKIPPEYVKIAQNERGRKIKKIQWQPAVKEWHSNHVPDNRKSTQKLSHNLALLAGDEKAAKNSMDLDETTPKVEADRIRAIYQAKREKFEYLIQRGEYFPRDEVEKELTSLGTEIREYFLQIADRITDNVMAADSRDEAHEIIFSSIEDSLRKAAEAIEKKAADYSLNEEGEAA